MQRMAVAGGYDCDFVDPVPDELKCPICLFPCRSPHVLSCCGLKICENCVGPIELSCNPVCPKCRESFTHFLEKDVDRQILGRNVRCSRNADGCKWIGQLRHLDKHVRDECKWTLAQCRLPGCSMSVPRHQLAVHEKEECPLRPIEKKFEVFTRKIKEEYWKEMAELRAEYGKEMAELRVEYGKKMAELRVENGKEMAELRAESRKEVAERREEYGKEMAELRGKYDALQQRVLDLENKPEGIEKKPTATTGDSSTSLGSKFKRSFSADNSRLISLLCILSKILEKHICLLIWDKKVMALIGVATSVLLALLIYVSTGSLLENNISAPPVFFPVLEQPLQILVSQPLYILHQMAHWAMVYYAHTRLKCSHKLQPFHFWMAGMNLVFVLLYVAQSYLFPHKISYHLPGELPFFVVGLSYWFLIAKSSYRGFIFGYSDFHFRDIAEVARMSLPYYFSFAVLINFWYKPFIDRYGCFLVRLVFELILIYSCLIQKDIHWNKYWSILLELMVLLYMLVIFCFPVLPIRMPILILMFSLVCAAVFVISQIHELLIDARLTRLGKLIITVSLISLFAILLMSRNPHDKLNPGGFAFILIVFYYIGLNVIMVVLMLIKYLIDQLSR